MNNQWLYSQAAIDVVQEYALKFPKLFQLMNKQSNALNDPIFESELNNNQKVSKGHLTNEFSKLFIKHQNNEKY